MRELTHHKIEGHDDQTTITAVDAPGNGGAHHQYHVEYGNSVTVIFFQNGAVKEAGVNGLQMEHLMSICIDRLECFQAGPYPNANNGLALAALKSAMGHLHVRTKERIARGVEGKLKA